MKDVFLAKKMQEILKRFQILRYSDTIWASTTSIGISVLTANQNSSDTIRHRSHYDHSVIFVGSGFGLQPPFLSCHRDVAGR